jgi:hypothetical protein
MTQKLMFSFLLVLLLLPGLAMAGAITINEVQANPRQSVSKAAYQWFELYNSSGVPVTLSNWTVWNRDGSDVIPAVTVPAKGFVVVAASEPAFRQNFPSFSGTIVTLSDGTIGSGLQDGYFDSAHMGDLLCLKDANGNVVDKMNWGNVDPSWPNNGLVSWNPGAPIVAPTHSLGRYPDGSGSGMISDWKDFPGASPGAGNPPPGTGQIAPTTWGKIKALYSEKWRQMFM